MDELEGIAAADARLGRPFPLPARALPLARWVEVQPVGDGAEVEWNLDDSRGGPGRLALYAGPTPAPDQGLEPAGTVDGREHFHAALDHAQPSLRPARELRWQAGPLHLRLTGQGPWELDELLAVAASIEP